MPKKIEDKLDPSVDYINPKNKTQQFIQLIEDGDVDEDLHLVNLAIKERYETKKDAVRAQVREIFGEDFEILPKEIMEKAMQAATVPQHAAPHPSQPATAPEDDKYGPDEGLTTIGTDVGNSFESRSPQIGSVEQAPQLPS